MVLMRRKSIEKYSVYLNINKIGAPKEHLFYYTTMLSSSNLDLLYVASFHIIINPYNPSKEIISSIYIIANYHFTILKVW